MAYDICNLTTNGKSQLVDENTKINGKSLSDVHYKMSLVYYGLYLAHDRELIC